MRPISAMFLLTVGLSGCAVQPYSNVLDTHDPGRLPGALHAVSIAQLRPCNDGLTRTLHIDPSQPVNILVHGCKGSTGRFRALAEVLAFHGQQTACFEYDDRDSLMVSSGELARSIDRLAQELDDPKITVIGHSMGGLVARKALVQDHPAPSRNQFGLSLVTVSAPFAGIASARMCAVPALRIATLGLNDFACWLISGDNWFEITAATDFIQKPGRFIPQVARHLEVVTDERGTCRRRDAAGRCVTDDYIFSLDEQRHPPVSQAPGATQVEVAAGHVEIVGESGVTPHKLISVFQQEGIVRATPPERRSAFQALLTRLYGR